MQSRSHRIQHILLPYGGVARSSRLFLTRPEILLAFQVLIAAEDTLRRLQVSGAERNAILDTLRYMESLHERQLSHAQASTGLHQAALESDPTFSRADKGKEASDAKPFTRCGRLFTVFMLCR